MPVMWDGHIQVGDFTIVECWHNKASVIIVMFEMICTEKLIMFLAVGALWKWTVLLMFKRSVLPPSSELEWSEHVNGLYGQVVTQIGGREREAGACLG
jgi:hypothetical protein